MPINSRDRNTVEYHFNSNLAPALLEKFQLKSEICFEQSEGNISTTHFIKLFPESTENRKKHFLAGNIIKVVNYIYENYGSDAPFTIYDVNNKTEGEITIRIEEIYLHHKSELEDKDKYSLTEPPQEILDKYKDFLDAWDIQMMKNNLGDLYVFIHGDFFTLYEFTENYELDTLQIRINLKLFRPTLNDKVSAI